MLRRAKHLKPVKEAVKELADDEILKSTDLPKVRDARRMLELELDINAAGLIEVIGEHPDRALRKYFHQVKNKCEKQHRGVEGADGLVTEKLMLGTLKVASKIARDQGKDVKEMLSDQGVGGHVINVNEVLKFIEQSINAPVRVKTGDEEENLMTANDLILGHMLNHKKTYAVRKDRNGYYLEENSIRETMYDKALKRLTLERDASALGMFEEHVNERIKESRAAELDSSTDEFVLGLLKEARKNFSQLRGDDIGYMKKVLEKNVLERMAQVSTDKKGNYHGLLTSDLGREGGVINNAVLAIAKVMPPVFVFTYDWEKNMMELNVTDGKRLAKPFGYVLNPTVRDTLLRESNKAGIDIIKAEGGDVEIGVASAGIIGVGVYKRFEGYENITWLPEPEEAVRLTLAGILSDQESAKRKKLVFMLANGNVTSCNVGDIIKNIDQRNN
ncbi:MAG: hypothetical protein V1921_01260 [Candidatus Altiarchaeota archaeon]